MSKELPKTYDHSDVESRLYENGKRRATSMRKPTPKRNPTA